MNESTLFLLAFVFYLGAAFFYLGRLFLRKDKPAGAGSILALAGLVLHTAAAAVRTVESGHAPFTNMYESLSFLAWASVLAYLIMERNYAIQKAGGYFMLVVVCLMALASSPLMPKNATPLVPALQSYWLWLHVSVTLLGEAFFAVAFITSIMYLAAESQEGRGLKPKSGQTAEMLEAERSPVRPKIVRLGVQREAKSERRRWRHVRFVIVPGALQARIHAGDRPMFTPRGG